MKQITRRAVRTIVGMTAGLFSTVLISGTAVAKETVNIQIFPGATLTIHAVIAKEKGFCDKHGLNCELKPIPSGTVALQALMGKSVDAAMIGTEMIANAIARGANLSIVSMGVPDIPQMLVVRSDIPTPNAGQGYPALIKDLKGLKVGVPARGSQAEIWIQTMLADAGLKPSDVMIVAVGAPATAYTSLVASKQVDAVMNFEPINQLCGLESKCKRLLDLSQGQGPAIVKSVNGAAAGYIMRGTMLEEKPQLADALNAAFEDAAMWIHDPANFDELVAIYTPILGYKELPNYKQFIAKWMKEQLPKFSRDLKTDRAAAAATIDFYRNHVKMFNKDVTIEQLVWSKAP